MAKNIRMKTRRTPKTVFLSLKKRFLESRLYSDIANYDINNQDAARTLRSNFFSAYKRKLVIRMYSNFFTSAGLPGLILLNSKEKDNPDGAVTLRHEYGHTLQAERLGCIKYGIFIFVPSVMCNLLSRRHSKKGMRSLYMDYYNLPWERSADALGGVEPESERARNYRKSSDKLSEKYFSAIDEFPF
ncbi:MAG: hypothetical protein IJP17_07250 [Clostridia bacterium]|nr:hypothetical protein [Clostridia bacterium]